MSICEQPTCDCSDGTWNTSNSKWGDNCYQNFSGVGHGCIVSGGQSLQFVCDNDAEIQFKNNPVCNDKGVLVAKSVTIPGGEPCEVVSGTARTANECYDSSLHNQGCFGNVNAGWGPQDEGDCITQAEIDYCRELGIAEEIDPTDLGLTGDEDNSSTWGIVAALVDSGVYSQLGGQNPILTMKGFVQWDQPVEQAIDDPERPDGPRGVIYEVAGGLRLGIMKLRENGSRTGMR